MSGQLWAKGWKKGDVVDPPTVLKHCRDAREAGEAVWDAIEGDLATALKLPREQLRKFRPMISALGLLHDLAKINSAFQAILPPDRPTDLRQPVRHEIFGAMLLADPD